MARAVLPALLVAVLVVVATVGAVAVPSPSSAAQIEDERTADVEKLGLSSPSRSDVRTQGVDVSTAVAIQREAARSEIDRGALEVAFERTDDEQGRRELLFEAATDVEIAISELRSEERALRAGYVNGSVGPTTYVRGRAAADARAEQLLMDLEQIQRHADRVPQLSMRSRLEALRVALTGADGPVSDRAEATIAGEQPAVGVYVEASPDGRVLSMVTEDRYVREAYRSDLWTPDTTSGIRFDEAEERMGELYPVAFHPNSSRRVARSMSEYGAGTYRVSMELREGTITTYLDGDTRNVFFEVQDFALASIEPGPMVAMSDNGTRLVVNRTYEGGPLRVAVFDNATRTPVDVTVLVGKTPYRTGTDGVVWALDPAGPTDVVALGEAGNASVNVLPLSPSLVDVTPVE